MKNFLSVGRQPAVLTARPPAGATVKESSRICENFLSIGQPDGPAERVVKNQVGPRKFSKYRTTWRPGGACGKESSRISKIFLSVKSDTHWVRGKRAFSKESKHKKKLSKQWTTCLADKTNHPVERLSLNRSQCGSCSTKYDTLAGT